MIPTGYIFSAFSLAGVAYLLWMVVVIVGGIDDALGDIADQIAGPSRFTADGIAEVTK